MSDNQPAWIELGKYPITILSIFLALVGAKYVLGITFGPVSEISADGVKFSQDARGEIASLSAQVNAVTKSLEEMKRQLPSTQLSAEARSAVFEASQIVSDQTAQVTKLYTAADSTKSALTGYIWVGDYNNKTGEWTRIKLVSPQTNATVTTPLTQISPGTIFAVTGNLVVRDGLPQNDKDYYQGRKSIGVIPSATHIKILSAPVGIDREYAVQYWAQVTLQP